MAETILKAKRRELGTKGDINQLRRDGFVPGVYYSKGKEQITFAVEAVALNKFVFTSASNIIQLTFEGEEPIGCIIKDVQFDPVTDHIVHLDMQGVTLGQVLQIDIPTNFIGSAIGVKEGGILQEQLHKLEVECLPRNIPQHIDIDVSELGIGDAIYVKDLELEDIKFLNNDESIIVSVVPPKAEEVEEDEDADSDAPVQPEVISKGKTEEE
jgi:large subunit ribosomal protein L25